MNWTRDLARDTVALAWRRQAKQRATEAGAALRFIRLSVACARRVDVIRYRCRLAQRATIPG